MALGDAAPPDDFEEDCTVEKQQKDGETCVLCEESNTWEPDGCKKRHDTDGYTKRCKAFGGDQWNEIWCKSGGTPTDPPKNTDVTPASNDKGSSSSCSAGNGAARTMGLGLALLCLGLVWARRREP